MILALVTVVDAAPAFGPKEYVVQARPAAARRSSGFPPASPSKGGRLRVENGPNGRARVSLAVLVLNQRETVLMLEGPGQRRVVERAVQLGASNTLLVWMIGPPGATLAVSVTSAGACLDVAITSPAPGATVPEGPLLVRGTVQRPAFRRASASTASPPWFTAGQWAVEIPVDSTVELLTASASVVGGASDDDVGADHGRVRHLPRPSSFTLTRRMASCLSSSPGKL